MTRYSFGFEPLSTRCCFKSNVFQGPRVLEACHTLRLAQFPAANRKMDGEGVEPCGRYVSCLDKRFTSVSSLTTAADTEMSTYGLLDKNVKGKSELT